MKSLIKLLVLVCVFFITSCDDNDGYIDQKRWVRKNIHSVEAKKDVEALNKALQIMRSKNCSDPTSWYYQGAMHWIPDTIINNHLCDSYHTTKDIKEGWDNCTHTPSGQEKIHFLIWHRLYTYHFEKIVRRLSGYQDFALPYWDYTNPTGNNRQLPDMFRDKTSSLYEVARYEGLNNGEPVSGEIERALDITKLMTYTDFKMFSNNMNAAPHGAMHDYIGSGNDTTGTLQFNNSITGTITNTGLMGWVPTAAFDPIFWTHHSNIDRIWQQWTNSENGKLVTLQQLKSAEWPYVFFDENGEKVTYTMEDAIKIIYTMDYDFDDTKVTGKYHDELVMSNLGQVIASNTNSVLINDQITDAVTLKSLLKSNGSKLSKVKMTITTSFTKVPKGSYEVYNNYRVGNKPSDSNFVGFMTFFGSDHKMIGESCEKGCCRELTKSGRPQFTFEYEVDMIDLYNVSIYKHNGKHTGDLVIESIIISK